MRRLLTDENAKSLARRLVEEALHEAHWGDAGIHAVYLIPDRHLIVVVVMVGGQRARVAFRHQVLSEYPESAAQQARRFVTEELPRRDSATTAKPGNVALAKGMDRRRDLR